MRVASGVLPCTDYPPLGSASEWYCTWCIVVSRTYGGRLKRNQMSNARNRHKIQNLANNLSTKKGANPDNSIQASKFRRYQKEMQGRSALDRLNVGRMVSHIRGKYFFDHPKYDGLLSKFNNVEEVIVYGNVFNSIGLDPKEFSLSDIQLMRGVRLESNDLYDQGRYDEAYPLWVYDKICRHLGIHNYIFS